MTRTYIFVCKCGGRTEVQAALPPVRPLCACGAAMRRDWRAEGGKEFFHPSREVKK